LFSSTNQLPKSIRETTETGKFKEMISEHLRQKWVQNGEVKKLKEEEHIFALPFAYTPLVEVVFKQLVLIIEIVRLTFERY